MRHYKKVLLVDNIKYCWDETNKCRVRIANDDGGSNQDECLVKSKQTSDFTLVSVNARSIVNKAIDFEHVILHYNPHVMIIAET